MTTDPRNIGIPYVAPGDQWLSAARHALAENAPIFDMSSS
jgi:hypothetical protein